MAEKIVGIMGGLGPEATIDLFRKIVSATQAKSDEDHLRIIIDNNPKMPSRLDAILANGPSPVPAMVETARNLVRAGADFIVIAANTAHWFHGDVQAGVNVPVLHMIKETVKWTIKSLPHKKAIGLLATTGTVRTKMYENEYLTSGIRTVVPSEKEQSLVMESIIGFKYGEAFEGVRQKMVGIAKSLVKNGAEAIVMGCTEVPIILEGYESSVPLIDPNQVMAEVIVKVAKSED
jgi:aspartate racemase